LLRETGQLANAFDFEGAEPLADGVLKVARVGGHLEAVAQHGSQTVVTAEESRPLTPVYRALAFRRNRRWWSFWHSWLEVRPVIPTRSFAFDLADPDDILPGLPSRAVPAALDEDGPFSSQERPERGDL
jgi:hypothetical protein